MQRNFNQDIGNDLQQEMLAGHFCFYQRLRGVFVNKLGYVRVMAASPALKVANCTYNSERICEMIEQAEAQHCDLLVLPELCTTGYTCGDLFLHKTLLDASDRALVRLAEATRDKSVIVVAGAPIRGDAGKLYNAAAVLCGGRICAFVPKCNPSRV